MAQIQPLSFPIIGEATTLNVVVSNFKTSDTTCIVFYELVTADGKKCLEGNYTLTEEEFTNWGSDNSYIDNLVANIINVQIII